MKNNLLLVPITIFVSQLVYSQGGQQPEMILVVRNNAGLAIATGVELYEIDDVSLPIKTGSSKDAFYGQNYGGYQGNFLSSIRDLGPSDWSDGTAFWPSQPGTWYYLKVADRFIQMYVPYDPECEGLNDPSGDFVVIYNTDTGNFSVPWNDRCILSETSHRYDGYISRTWSIAPKVTVRNSFGGGGKLRFGGENPVEYINVPSSGFIFKRGGSHVVQAIDRQYIQDPGGQYYYRVYQNWTDQGGQMQAVAPQLSFTPNITQDVTYTANFLKEYNIVLTTAIGFESGASGTYEVNEVNKGATYTGPIVQFQNFEALPSSGWFFREWSDGITDNPRIPTDHVTGISAKLKAHLASNHAIPTQAIGQRRIVGKADGSEYVLLYESAGESFLMT